MVGSGQVDELLREESEAARTARRAVRRRLAHYVIHGLPSSEVHISLCRHGATPRRSGVPYDDPFSQSGVSTDSFLN